MDTSRCVHSNAVSIRIGGEMRKLNESVGVIPTTMNSVESDEHSQAVCCEPEVV